MLNWTFSDHWSSYLLYSVHFSTVFYYIPFLFNLYYRLLLRFLTQSPLESQSPPRAWTLPPGPQPSLAVYLMVFPNRGPPGSRQTSLEKEPNCLTLERRLPSSLMGCSCMASEEVTVGCTSVSLRIVLVAWDKMPWSESKVNAAIMCCHQ